MLKVISLFCFVFSLLSFLLPPIDQLWKEIVLNFIKKDVVIWQNIPFRVLEKAFNEVIDVVNCYGTLNSERGQE